MAMHPITIEMTRERERRQRLTRESQRRRGLRYDEAGRPLLQERSSGVAGRVRKLLRG